MTRAAYEEAKETGINSFSLAFRDYGVKRGCKHFVETGTYLGTGVEYAIGHGFEEIFRCELSEERYNICMEKFKDNDNVNLWLGDSRDCVKEILKKVDEKACFWLDAHAEGGGVPTMEEIDMIKDHSIKNHTIIIDDIPVYFGEDGKKQLKKRILDINPDYKFIGWSSHAPDDEYALVAYV